jgi:hypothetical protein
MTRQVFSEVIVEKDLELIKRASEVGAVQFHRNIREVQDPFTGRSDLHDRLTAAFNEVADLDAETQARAAAIFERHGLGGHGFAASVVLAYVREWDKHGKDAMTNKEKE